MSKTTSKKASATKPSKEKKSPQVLMKELTAENEKLKEDLVMAQNQIVEYKSRVACTNRQVMGCIETRTLKDKFNLLETADPLSLSVDTVSEMLQIMTVKHKTFQTSVEAQLMVVEKELTKLSLELARMSRKTLAYEQTMSELEECRNLEQVMDKVQHMRFIAGKGYQSFHAVDPIYVEQHFQPIIGLNGPDDRPEAGVMRAIENVRNLNLVAPLKRMPGDTHINNMDSDLRLYLTVELSFEKPSGNDWRRMAERIGVSYDNITQWQTERLQYAMGHVFNVWSKDPEATVRMLHRHLKSPQMKALILAKRVADYYQVD